MKQLKRIGRRLVALTAPYDVPADHVYSRQSLDAHNREFPLAKPSAAETNTTEGSFSLSAADLRGSAA